MQIRRLPRPGLGFRAVFKKDRHGDLLDADGAKIIPGRSDEIRQGGPPGRRSPGQGDAVRRLPLRRRGPRQRPALRRAAQHATTITCIDCHGTIDKRPTLITTGKGGMLDKAPGQPSCPVDIGQSATTWGPRFFWQGTELYQQSSMSARREVGNSADDRRHRSRLAPLQCGHGPLRQDALRDGTTWGDVPRTPPSATRSWPTPQRTWIARFAIHVVGDELLWLPPADEAPTSACRRTNSRAPAAF
jgi:hypothetical protein